MDDDDVIDIELQDADDIGCRLILLAALVLWPQLDEPDRKHWFSWLKAQGVLDVAEPYEVDLLRSPGPDSQTEAIVAGQSLNPLAWTVRLTDELPLRSEVAILTAITDQLPVPPEAVEPFLDDLTVRDESAIAQERERAELWNWRLSSEPIRRVARGIELVELMEAIREVVQEAASSGLIRENDGTDFLVDGVPVRALDEEAGQTATFAAMERLRALDWVCGLDEWGQLDSFA